MDHNNTLPQKKVGNFIDLLKDRKETESLSLRHDYDFKGENYGIRSVNVTSDNRYLIITFENSDGRIRILDLGKLEFFNHKFSDHTDSVRLTSIAKDNKAFYTASWDGTSRRYEIATGKCMQVLGGIGRSPSCYLDPEQKYLFTASYDSDIEIDAKNTGRCWEIKSGEPVYLYRHTKERRSCECMDIAYDQRYVYTGSDDGTALKWDLTGDKPLLKYFDMNGAVRKIAVSEKYFAAACTDGFVRVHYKTDGRHFRYLIHSEAEVREVRISQDETKLYSASADGSLKCFSLGTGDQLFHSKVHSDWIWSIILLNDYRMIITGSHDGSVGFISSDTGDVIARLFIMKGYEKFLFSSPPDKAFANGLFYTNNTDLIQVRLENGDMGHGETLEAKDPRRVHYISKLNLKNLIIARLRSNEKYISLTENYLKDRELRTQPGEYRIPPGLRASFD